LPELRQPPSDFLSFSNAFDGPDLYGESNAELAAISAGERGVSGSAFASRTGFTMYVFFKWRFRNSLITKIQGTSQRNAAQKLKNLKSSVRKCL
jgi:hypothetical protein